MESKSAIKNVEKFSSFASSVRGIEYFIATDDREFGVVIKTNVSGIDIKALADKHRENISRMVFQYTDTEDEIVSLDDISNFEIVGIVIEDELQWIKQ